MVLWMTCVLVGAVGLAVSYPHPATPSRVTPPIQAEILDIELSAAEFTPNAVDPLTFHASLPVPPTLEMIGPPAQVPLLAVAEPAPAVAFSLPVEGPTRIVEPAQAAFTHSLASPGVDAALTPPVQTLAYGQGEGRQPAPEYPRQAVREGQEGVVTLRFSVAESGRVLAAETVSAAPWPLLNAAALRAVRERWRFRPGPVRLYEVAIRFELKR